MLQLGGDLAFAWTDRLSTDAKVRGGVGISYALAPTWRVRGGYGVIILSGLLLAPEQFDLHSGYFGTQIDDTGMTVYHGVTLGLQADW